MRQPLVDDCVRLLNNVPQFWLSRGDIGVVKSIWLDPMHAYEVEFQSPPGSECYVRALLSGELVEVDEELSEPAAHIEHPEIIN